VAGPNDMLIPLRNNAAGKMTGLELILKSLITEYSPVDTRSKGFNVRALYSAGRMHASRFTANN
jgi:hypothetical protein